MQLNSVSRRLSVYKYIRKLDGYLNIDFVGYYPDLDTIIVSHEGTDPTEL